MSVVRLNNVSLNYMLYGVSTRSLKRDIVNLLLRRKKQQTENITCVEALSNISFELKDGDFLGLVGHNGAGKSTLLRVLADIYEPTIGELYTEGSISAILSSSVGLQPELSGYENIYINSIIKNYSGKQYNHIVKDIEDFTELAEFLSLPVKTYSQGMQARLAFGISTAIHPDILLLDEVVGTGDAYFIDKASARLHDLMRKANIMVMASHNDDIVKQFCNKLMWLDHGHIKAFGDVDEVLAKYIASTKK